MQYRNPRQHCQPEWKTLVYSVLGELLPMACLLCGSACTEANLCAGCLAGLPRNQPACRACGQSRADLVDGRCAPCLANPPAWDRLYAPMRYEFPSDVLIRMLKFHRRLAAAPALAHAMLAMPADHPPPKGDLLVPVPLHWTRLCLRGFNQAGELARCLSRAHAVPVAWNRLRKVRRTRPQTALDAAGRRRNLRDAFVWKGRPLDGARVVLIDDVMTTGSTAHACALSLREAGAHRVDVWVAARAPG